MSTDPLVAAIHRNDLPRYARSVLGDPTATDAARQQAQRALTTCQRIGTRIAAERDRLAGRLQDGGLDVWTASCTPALQRHELVLEVDVGDVDPAAALLAADGYVPRHTWSGGASRSARHYDHEITLVRSNDETTVVRLRWRPPTPGRRSSGIRSRLFRPTPADWDLADLPGWAWRTYPAVRVVRLALERAGIRSRSHATLEPFLVTPFELIEPLLTTAEVNADDVVLDFGCGDGRLVVEAARRRRCRAIGVEQSTQLTDQASAAAVAAGVAGRVRIEHGDGDEVDLSGVTVVLMFVPLATARRAIPIMLERLPGGARIVVHEQSALPPGFPQPDDSVALFGDESLTVAHRWIASGTS